MQARMHQKTSKNRAQTFPKPFKIQPGPVPNAQKTAAKANKQPTNAARRAKYAQDRKIVPTWLSKGLTNFRFGMGLLRKVGGLTGLP